MNADNVFQYIVIRVLFLSEMVLKENKKHIRASTTPLRKLASSKVSNTNTHRSRPDHISPFPYKEKPTLGERKFLLVAIP
jgi:hypothetical protein